jgi:hypothetical protein
MWVDPEAAVRVQWQDRIREAERQRLATHARESQGGARRSLSGSWGRLRQAAGFGLVRTGLRLLDEGRA